MFTQVLTSATTNVTSTAVIHSGGEVDIAVNGVFGGASVALQANFTGVDTWVPVSEGTAACAFTVSLIKTLKVSRRCQLRLVITGATGTTSLNGWI